MKILQDNWYGQFTWDQLPICLTENGHRLLNSTPLGDNELYLELKVGIPVDVKISLLSGQEVCSICFDRNDKISEILRVMESIYSKNTLNLLLQDPSSSLIGNQLLNPSTELTELPLGKDGTIHLTLVFMNITLIEP